MTNDEQREALDAVIGNVRWPDGVPVIGERAGGMIADALIAAGYRLPEADEWEYGVRDDSPTSYYGKIIPTADESEANFGASVDSYMTPVRRRKAGEWEVVPDPE